MEQNEILLGKKKHYGARNETNIVPAELVSTSKPVVRKDLKETVDLYDVYVEEASKCTKYRVTLTIKPYCTNVLFNMCTEIVDVDGAPVSDREVIQPLSDSSVYGKYRDLKRAYMVSNTEYSSPDIGFTYYPGYDIFDNHTLRNLSFRPIMPVMKINGDTRYVFNTIRDYMRTKDGKVVEFCPRFSTSDVDNATVTDMHIYEHSNLLRFSDGSSAEANLKVVNGWYGFHNNSAIEERIGKEGQMFGVSGELHVYSHTLNNVGNCEFIDMFPNREQYSFVPQYNMFKKRYEKNWDVFLTYPWKNFMNHNLVRNVKMLTIRRDADCETDALLTMRVSRCLMATNRKSMLIRTFTKHNLSVNDKIAAYVSNDGGRTYQRLKRVYKVDCVGDTSGNNPEYFFGISSKSFLNDLLNGSIIDLFYEERMEYVDEFQDVSIDVTDVPDEYSPTVIRVFYYNITSIPTGTYDDTNTFYEMPKNVNSRSPINIRVWDGIFKYMEWSPNNFGGGVYYVSQKHEGTEYGDWNTYDDIPGQYTFQYIRTRNGHFEYGTRIMKMYQMKNNIDIDETINKLFSGSQWSLRFTKIVDGTECQYYIRQFRKIPNLKFSSEALPVGMSDSEDNMVRFIEKNASKDDGGMLEFDSETYKLAFSKTVYGDEVAQVTFTDTLDINNLTDNLGRPVTDIYATIVKRNKGYKEWYENMGLEDFGRLVDSEETEMSRCFGSVTTGFEFLDLDDEFDRSSYGRGLKGYMSSASMIYRNSQERSNDIPLSVEEWDDGNENNEITDNDDVFFGDVVEYNPVKCTETVLSDACFRFNTAQREVGLDGQDEDFDFSRHEILYDDFDPLDTGSDRSTPFLAVEYKQWLSTQDETEAPDVQLDTEMKIKVRRNEGYFYKPHNRIPLLKFSDKISQASHRTIHVSECYPVQLNGLYVMCRTQTAHGVGGGDVVYICNGDNWLKTTVSYVVDKYRFAIAPVTKDDSGREYEYMDWIEVCKWVNNGLIQIRKHNPDIPSYARNIGDNLFVWREIVNPAELVGDTKYSHPFANGAFYVEEQPDVYLRRQDPEGINGLNKGEFGEIQGKIFKGSNNVYKHEELFLC